VTAGYSGTSLDAKLGVKPGSRVLIDGAPDGFALPLPDGASLPARGPYDVILCFCPDAARLRARFGPLRNRLTEAGRLWIAWPKKSSGVPTDLSENDLRAYGLSTGLVDVKVCAVDATWSGLAFVVRLADRR
jgi:hypothetical protein